MRKTCPFCMSYLLDHLSLKGWKKCNGCGYCEDKEGNNALSNNKPLEENVLEELNRDKTKSGGDNE